MKRHMRDAALHRWHSLLALPRQPSAAWHRARLAEELAERRAATTGLARLSETADVMFTLSRARHESVGQRALPDATAVVLLYMAAKFGLRWAFYRLVALACGVRGTRLRGIREVVNPGRMAKVQEVARRHGVDGVQFATWARRVAVVWPLLP